MTEREQAAAVESALSGDWQCGVCLGWLAKGAQWERTSGPGWGPWCKACWQRWIGRPDNNPTMSIDREKAIFQMANRKS